MKTVGSIRKEKIFKKATMLFTKRGFEKTTLKEIGRVSGIKGEGIYHYFASKEKLLLDILEIAENKFKMNVLDVIEKIKEPEEKLKVLINNMTKLIAGGGEAALLMDSSILRGCNKKVINEIKKRERNVLYLTRDLLKEVDKINRASRPVDPTLGAFCLFSMMGNIYRWYNPKGRITVSELVKDFEKIFFYGYLGIGTTKRKVH